MRHIQTLSCVLGDKRCDGNCPFCVSKMTGYEQLSDTDEIDLINFEKACLLAKGAHTSTVLLTGKGEPMLNPSEVSNFLALLTPFRFPLIEIQTNGLALGRLAQEGKSHVRDLTIDRLQEWRALGLNTIALSIVGIHNEQNAQIYHSRYPDLSNTIRFLREQRFTIRLCVMMQKGIVDTAEKVKEVVDFARANHVAQLTVRSIRRPDNSHNEEVGRYVDKHKLSPAEEQAIFAWVQANGAKILPLSHGTIYDIDGQNVCVSDCLTTDEVPDEMREIIFYSDGTLAYSWAHRGAVLLSGSTF